MHGFDMDELIACKFYTGDQNKNMRSKIPSLNKRSVITVHVYLNFIVVRQI